jgi:hypothetical protein
VGRSDNDRQFFFLNSRPVDLPKLTRVVNEVRESRRRGDGWMMDGLGTDGWMGWLDGWWIGLYCTCAFLLPSFNFSSFFAIAPFVVVFFNYNHGKPTHNRRGGSTR